MNFRQLQAFQEVMRAGSVTKAAENLGRTQPAISSLIVGLEQSVGYNLFDRLVRILCHRCSVVENV